MVTVQRGQGLRVVKFANDHHPAHVHLFGDGHAKIDLYSALQLTWADGMTRGEIRHAMQIVIAHQGELLARWESIHGGPD
jgi:hypothetical protein